MASVTVQSLLNAATYNSYTVTLASDTVDDLKNDIASATGVNVAWFDLVLNEQILTGTDTLQTAGVADNDRLRTANKIDQLATRQARQEAKLLLASLDRAASSNPRDTFDISELPARYSGNTTVDNPNAGGLVTGRPWQKLDAGLYLQPYSGYFADNPNWFATATTTGTASTPSVFTTASIPTTTSWQYLGYFRAPNTGSYTFSIASDDASYLWIGGNASSGFTTGNALASNPGEHGVESDSGTLSLVEGYLYAFRAQVGNNGGPGSVAISFSGPGISTTNTFTNYVFHNPDTNGL